MEIEELAMVSAIVLVSAMVSVSLVGEDVRKKEGSGMVGDRWLVVGVCRVPFGANIELTQHK